ncbi:MAG: hypothetical protein IAE79_26700 [Anaerolinea sp.]|nr:hypothetical protein [Anaerolinea sp.]
MPKHIKIVRVLLVLLVVTTLAFTFMAIVDHVVLQMMIENEWSFHTLLEATKDPTMLGDCAASISCTVGS